MATKASAAAPPRSAVGRPHALPALTGIRFLAAFYVVLEHGLPWLTARTRLPRVVVTFVGNGYLAVSMFFLLSGFILTYTYQDLRGGEDRFRFWIARFARIYPVYLLSLLLTLPFESGLHWGTKLSVLGMVQAWNPWRPGLAGAWNFPAWTLSVEAFFYLCFPFLLLWLKPQSGRIQNFLIALVAGVCVLGHTPLQGLQGRVGEAAMISWLPLPLLRLPEFLLGMLIGLRFLRREQAVRGAHGHWKSTAYAIATLALLSSPIGNWKSLVIIPFGLLVYEFASGGGWIAHFLSTAFMVLLGGASYAVYLLQYPVRSWVRVGFLHLPQTLSFLGAPLTPLILVLFSILIFKFWEEPTRRFIRALFASRMYDWKSKVPSGDIKLMKQRPGATRD